MDTASDGKHWDRDFSAPVEAGFGGSGSAPDAGRVDAGMTAVADTNATVGDAAAGASGSRDELGAPAPGCERCDASAADSLRPDVGAESGAPSVSADRDEDECALEIDNCAENATCTDTADGFSCECLPGFSGDGLACSAEAVAVAVAVATGDSHTCALLDNGKVRCWGSGRSGRLGYGNTDNIGDDEVPAAAGDVEVGGTVVQLVTGYNHTCVLLDSGKVRCWGEGDSGELGYGNTDDIGDDEVPAAAGDVELGGTVVQLAGGSFHTCALLDTGKVRCWGRINGSFDSVGDDEVPATAGDVELGGTAVQLVPGKYHTCAVLESGKVPCWKRVPGEVPATAADVEARGAAVQLAEGHLQTCALLHSGKVRCWGGGYAGHIQHDLPYAVAAPASDAELGGSVIQLVAGFTHTCALLEDGKVRCWGSDTYGTLDYGDNDYLGDEVEVGGVVVQLAARSSHICALLDTGRVRCWGEGYFGRLGYGNTDTIGDDETVASAGDVHLF